MAYRAQYRTEGSTALKPEVVETEHEARIIDFNEINPQSRRVDQSTGSHHRSDSLRYPYCAEDRRVILAAATAFSSIFIVFAFMGF